MAVEDSFLKFITFIGQFQGEERCVILDKLKEDLVAFPHREFQQTFLFDPFEVAFVAYDLVADPVGADEEVHEFVFPAVEDEGDDAAVAPVRYGIARFFPHLAQRAVLGALPILEMSPYPKPFIVVEVVFFFGTVQHQVAVAAFEVAESGRFHYIEVRKAKAAFWGRLCKNL